MYQHDKRLLDLLNLNTGIEWPKDFFLTLIFNGDPEIGLLDISPEEIKTLTVGVKERKYDTEEQETSLEDVSVGGCPITVFNIPVGHT